MFSPEAAAIDSVAARNPKRRQRTASEDSVAVRPNPKRIRRSNLTHETFLPPDSTKQNGHASHDAEPPHTNGHVEEPRSQRQGSIENASLAVRRKSSGKVARDRKPARTDGAIELVGCILRGSSAVHLLLTSFQTKNENYVVTQLPSTPQILESTQQSGMSAISVSLWLGLILHRAMAWRSIYGLGLRYCDEPNPSNNLALHPRLSFTGRSPAVSYNPDSPCYNRPSKAPTTGDSCSHLRRAGCSDRHAREWKSHILGKSISCINSRCKATKTTQC